MRDEFATVETASVERVKLALKAVEGLSTEILRGNMTNLFLLQGTAAIQTCKRLGVPIDNVLWGEQKQFRSTIKGETNEERN